MGEAHSTSKSKGFWAQEVPAEYRIPRALCLIHSEISEALEAFRLPDCAITEVRLTQAGKPEGFASEMADVVIRVLDLCAAYSVPLPIAMQLKMAYNRSREHRHGKRM